MDTAGCGLGYDRARRTERERFVLLDLAWAFGRLPLVFPGARAARARGRPHRCEVGVTETVELRPGLTPLADWRAIYRGAAVTLDPIARADVEAGRAALAAILSQERLPPSGRT